MDAMVTLGDETIMGERRLAIYGVHTCEHAWF